jgi:hypothetical protein
MKFDTATFTLGGGNVHYCSYCGERAKCVDQGSTHNHRWEEELVHFCECETALKEEALRKEKAEYGNKVYHLDRQLSDMVKLTDNPTVNKIKYGYESRLLKAKYNIE